MVVVDVAPGAPLAMAGTSGTRSVACSRAGARGCRRDGPESPPWLASALDPGRGSLPGCPGTLLTSAGHQHEASTSDDEATIDITQLGCIKDTEMSGNSRHGGWWFG